MKKVTLHILAEDIKTTDYTNSRDCAITRALKRAGLDMHEGGGRIYEDPSGRFNAVCRTPVDLETPVVSMYAFIDIKNKPEALKNWQSECLNIIPTEPKDFTFEFTFPQQE